MSRRLPKKPRRKRYTERKKYKKKNKRKQEGTSQQNLWPDEYFAVSYITLQLAIRSTYNLLVIMLLELIFHFFLFH
jgi:hypothetical protein